MSIDNTNNNIVLNLTLNILIATSITYFMSPDPAIFNDDKETFSNVLALYFGISIVALVICYLLINNDIDYPNKESQVTRFNQKIAWNIFFTSLLIPLLSFPQVISYTVSFVPIASPGTVLILLIVLIILATIYITSSSALGFLYYTLLVLMRRFNILWDPQILVFSDGNNKTRK